jgi:hypothetical protein
MFPEEEKMPQPKSASSKSTPGARSTSGRVQAKRPPASSSARATRAKPSTAGSASASRSTSSAGSTGSASSTKAKAATGSPDARLEAAAERLRKLNERIIEAGKQTGETTLSSYEKALKAIAGAVERGPGASDVDWISQLATTQAKFIRDVTQAWTSAARDMLK